VNELIDAIEKQKAWRENSGGQFRPEWKNPATWLSKGSWADEIPRTKTQEEIREEWLRR
jgi:hypothetical protein